jgi:DNA-binding transcriptional regulator YhcF (GntR family)
MSNNQNELFQAETSWFHIFKAMIDSGDVAKMGGTVFMVYSVVKSYTNWSTGRAFPSFDLLSEKTGLNRRTIIRSLATLETMNYIVKEQKAGKVNRYRLREQVPIIQEGRPYATASWDYLPSVVGEAHAELKNFLATGLENGRIVNIEHLHLTLNIANAGGVINNNGGQGYPQAKK